MSKSKNLDIVFYIMDSLKEARSQLREGNLNYAYKLITDEIEKRASKEAYEILGDVLFEMGNFEEALNAYSKTDNNLKKGKVMVSLGLYNDALLELGNLDNQEAHKLRAFCLLKLEKYEEALSEAEKFSGSDPLIFKIKGISEFKLGLLSDSIKDLSRALSMYHDDAELYYYKALAEEKLGEDKIAERDADMAITLNPYYAEVYLTKGRLMELHGKVNEAISLYGKAITLSPSMKEAYVRRAKAFMKIGDEEKAMIDIEKVNQLDDKESKEKGNPFS
jgi:tetratricopeptide (TPR) repeat protein